MICREVGEADAGKDRFWENVQREHGGCGIGFVSMASPTKEAVNLALHGLSGMKDRTGEAFGAGDGAGVIFETNGARGFFERFLPEGKNVSERDQLSVGMFFFEPELGETPTQQMNQVRRIMTEHNIYVHGWRKVPTNNEVLPAHVRGKASYKWQLLYSPGAVMKENKALYNRSLLFARRRIDREVKGVYPVSLNAGTMVYKAMATPGQLKGIYADDFNDPAFVTQQIAFHARMTSAGVTADKNAQFFRIVGANGNNTADGAMSSAQADAERRIGVTGIGEESVTVPHGMSDTAHFDGMVDVLTHFGVPLRDALRRRMLPARDDRLRSPKKVADYHEIIWRTQGPLAAYQGPGIVVGMTGRRINFAMDPLGLRTFWVYGNSEKVLGCSELGEIPIPLDELEFIYQMEAGQLGEVQGVRFTRPDHLESQMAGYNIDHKLQLEGNGRLYDLNLHPYAIVSTESPETFTKADVIKLWNQLGGDEYVMGVLQHMAAYGKEPVEGMGDVRPLAILSPARLRIASYFAQIVGVVTDPPMDSLREGGAMDIRITLGKDPKQLYEDNPNHFEVQPEFILDSPFMNPAQMLQLIQGNGVENGDKPKHLIIDTTFEGTSGADMEKKLEEIIAGVLVQAKDGEEPVLIFSDERCRGEEGRLFVPPVFIASAVNYALRQHGLRDNVKLVFDTMDALEAHDMALLIAQGADAVHPYLLWEAVIGDHVEYQKGDKFKKDIRKGADSEISLKKRMANVQMALDATLKGIMSKQGLTTMAGYRGSCLFEILGISHELSEKYFKYNVSRLGGLDFDDLVEDQMERLKEKPGAFRRVKGLEPSARLGKVMAYLNDVLLKKKSSNPEEAYKKLVEFIESERGPVFLRNLLQFVWAEERAEVCELPLEKVESVASIICRHFRGSQMSDGALGPVAHAAIAVAINELAAELMPELYDPSHPMCQGELPEGFEGSALNYDRGYSERLDPRPKSGSGEGGEHASRHPGGEFEAACSKSKQIASGRFGVDAYYLMSVGDDGELNIKIGQGAKPGQGGHAPGIKIDENLAKQRGTVAGIDLISPPTQHDIYNIEDLMRLIWDIRAVHPKIRTVSVKLTTKAGIGSVAVGVVKCGADKVGFSGREGGTGAAQSSAIRHTGAPLELGIFEAFVALRNAGMVDKVRLEVDGGIITGADVVKLAVMGADEFGFGTSILQAGEGCILCKDCYDGTVDNGCPVGICTRDAEALAYLGLGAQAAKLLGKDGLEPMEYAEQLYKCKQAIKHYWTEVAKDVQGILAKLRVPSLEACRGRFDLLKRVERGDRTDKIDLSAFWRVGLDVSQVPDFGDQPIAPKKAVNEINQKMIDAVLAYDGEGPFEMEIDMPGVADLDEFDVEMSMRTIGGTLAGMIASGKVVPPDGGFNFKFNGYVGQSFGFCMVEGMKLELQGVGRDFIASAMCGGKVVVKKPAHLKGQDIPLAGASCAYGARGGKLYVEGKAGQRFGVRNSGADLICEGTGKYSFEYMTGGTAVVLGETGYEMASGMSAGELFLWNANGKVADKLFQGLEKPAWMDEEEWAERTQSLPVQVETSEDDYAKLKSMLMEYLADTDSLKAKLMLDDWDNTKFKFAKVVPNTSPKVRQDSELGTERRAKGGEFAMMA